jgi:hypothetical protein
VRWAGSCQAKARRPQTAQARAQGGVPVKGGQEDSRAALTPMALQAPRSPQGQPALPRPAPLAHHLRMDGAGGGGHTPQGTAGLPGSLCDSQPQRPFPSPAAAPPPPSCPPLGGRDRGQQRAVAGGRPSPLPPLPSPPRCAGGGDITAPRWEGRRRPAHITSSAPPAGADVRTGGQTDRPADKRADGRVDLTGGRGRRSRLSAASPTHG